MRKLFFLPLLLVTFSTRLWAAHLFIPMDESTQANHLKAYGVAYEALRNGIEVDWLLNYKGGSFGMVQTETMERLCKLRGVGYEVMSDAQYNGIVVQIADP